MPFPLFNILKKASEDVFGTPYIWLDASNPSSYTLSGSNITQFNDLGLSGATWQRKTGGSFGYAIKAGNYFQFTKDTDIGYFFSQTFDLHNYFVVWSEYTTGENYKCMGSQYPNTTTGNFNNVDNRLAGYQTLMTFYGDVASELYFNEVNGNLSPIVIGKWYITRALVNNTYRSHTGFSIGNDRLLAVRHNALRVREIIGYNYAHPNPEAIVEYLNNKWSIF